MKKIQILIFLIGFVIGLLLINHLNKTEPIIIENEIVKIIEKRPLNDEMKLYSDFIKTKNNKVPKSVADIIAYEVVKQSKENNLSPILILSMIWVESRFDPLSTNKSGAKGLMQILNGGPNMKINWNLIYNIDYNIKIGIKILKEHLRLNDNDLNKALYGYVGGSKHYKNKVDKCMIELMNKKGVN